MAHFGVELGLEDVLIKLEPGTSDGVHACGSETIALPAAEPIDIRR